jgi:pyridoxine kinase
MAGSAGGDADVAILTFNSHVVCGNVGHNAGSFALRRLGHTVHAVPTVLFSNHPGRGSFRGRTVDVGLLRDLVEGLAEIQALQACRAALTGYLGEAGTAVVAAEAFSRIRNAGGDRTILVDPVIGDTGKGVYVRPALAEAIRDLLVPAADVVTPNLFELGYLTGLPTGSESEILAAIGALQRRGPRIVAVTSVLTGDTPAEAMDTFAAFGDSVVRTRSRLIAGTFSGSGDLFAGVFLARLLADAGPADALAGAVAATEAVLALTADRGSPELELELAQDYLLRAPVAVAVERLCG